jgi:pyruvate,orthophosphate dikinase
MFFFKTLHNRSLLEELAHRTNTTPQDCFSVVEALRDANPLLGVKGCRFSLVNPEFLGMQVRAALGAGLQVIREGDRRMGTVQFMIPMVSSEHETRALVQMVQAASEEFFAAQVTHLSSNAVDLMHSHIHELTA